MWLRVLWLRMPNPNLLQPDIPLFVRGWSLWVPPPLNTLGKPIWLNANDRPHWSSRAKGTKAWREASCAAAEDFGVPALEKAWVQAFFTFGSPRFRDVHNLYPTAKACIDGFTDSGLWVDDRDGILIGPDMRRDPKDARGVTPGVEFRIFEVIDSGH